MPVTILCPNPDCGASYSVVDETDGRCRECGAEIPLVPKTRSGSTPSGTEPDSIAPPPPIWQPGSIGRYQVLRTLGQGGMGTVYLAHDPQLDRDVAIKSPHPELARDPSARERFLREARAVARFHHPNFCPIHDIGEVDGLLFLAMAFIAGQTLAKSIERGNPWEPARAARVIRQLAEALAEAHEQGIIHRDLKPANIMVDARGTLIIMDFGLARRFDLEDSTITASGAVLGTPAYMPPEQAEGRKGAIGPRSDIYSLGVILYELLCGRRPFEGPPTLVLARILTTDPPPPRDLRPALSPELERICLKAMARQVDDRFASMGEFAGALQAWLDAPEPWQIESRPPDDSALEPAKPKAPPHPPRARSVRDLLQLAVLLIPIAAIGILIATHRDPTPQHREQAKASPTPSATRVASGPSPPEPKPAQSEPAKVAPTPATPKLPESNTERSSSLTPISESIIRAPIPAEIRPPSIPKPLSTSTPIPDPAPLLAPAELAKTKLEVARRAVAEAIVAAQDAGLVDTTIDPPPILDILVTGRASDASDLRASPRRGVSPEVFGAWFTGHDKKPAVVEGLHYEVDVRLKPPSKGLKDWYDVRADIIRQHVNKIRRTP